MPIDFLDRCVCYSLSCVLLCNTRDCSPPGSSVRGILQARILKQMPFPPPGDLSKDLSNPGIKPGSPESPALQADALLLK